MLARFFSGTGAISRWFGFGHRDVGAPPRLPSKAPPRPLGRCPPHPFLCNVLPLRGICVLLP